MASFLTTRSRNSELWFANNKPLQDSVLAYTARYAKRYNVKLYAFAIEGNHNQSPALFPEGNRADFMRDLNSSIARAVPRYAPKYKGGHFWARRYSAEFLPGPEDVEEYFFYTVLQPVQDGLVERISDYPGYNCFHDAVWGIERKFKFVQRGAYNAAKRHKQSISIKDYTEEVILKYERLPGYEHMSQKDYAELMHKKLEQRRLALIEKRLKEGLGFAGKEALLKVRVGSVPKHTKASTTTSHRPRILAVCAERRAWGKAWYFSNYAQYKEASRRYRLGELDVEFPEGTYRPCCRYHPPG